MSESLKMDIRRYRVLRIFNADPPAISWRLIRGSEDVAESKSSNDLDALTEFRGVLDGRGEHIVGLHSQDNGYVVYTEPKAAGSGPDVFPRKFGSKS